MDKVFAASIENVSRLCKNGYYDFIVVGSGMGGGNVARALIDYKVENSQKDKYHVLMIEQGGLMFTTHCVNTSCPRWNRSGKEGPSMDTDIVYRAVKSTFSVATSTSAEYDGGPVHCLGGRSNVWGLYTPRIHDTQLDKYFPTKVAKYLKGTGYTEAYKLLSNDEHADTNVPYPQTAPIVSISEIKGVLTDLDNICPSGPKSASKSQDKTKNPPAYICENFAYCPMAIQFLPRNPDEHLYSLTMGAFSSVNWELEHAYNKSENLTILLNTQVMTVNKVKKDSDEVFKIESLTVCDKSGHEHTIDTGRATVILCAGTVETAAIALRSNIKQPADDDSLVGKGLVDHDIWGTRYRYQKEVDIGSEGNTLDDQPLKVQSWVRLNPKKSSSGSQKHQSDYCLLNVTINAPSFLGHGRDDKLPCKYFDLGGKSVTKEAYWDTFRRSKSEKELKSVTVQVVFEFRAELKEENRVLNLPESIPTIDIRSVDDNYAYEPSMQKLAADIGVVLSRAGGGNDPPQEEIGGGNDPRIGGGNDPRIGGGNDPRIGGGGGNGVFPLSNALPKPPGIGTDLPNMSKSKFGTVAHEVGTMRMGKDKTKSVVDENLRVHGYGNLFVCDLSVFPVSPSANPSLTLVALALRLGKYLRENHCQAEN